MPPAGSLPAADVDLEGDMLRRVAQAGMPPEGVPMAAAKLVPLVAFLLLGVATPEKAAAPYANPVVLPLSRRVLARARNRDVGLHRRLALAVVGAMGASPRRILLGFLGVTAFLSLWISNTATALMLLPLALSLAPTVESDAEGVAGAGVVETAAPARDFATALLLGLAYSASLGGVGTLIGTPGRCQIYGGRDGRGLAFPAQGEASLAQGGSRGRPGRSGGASRVSAWSSVPSVISGPLARAACRRCVRPPSGRGAGSGR